MCLEYPLEEEEEGQASGPTLSTSTKTTSGKKSDLKRGQHGRHKVHNKVHADIQDRATWRAHGARNYHRHL
jgi:hypothetical protein